MAPPWEPLNWHLTPRAMWTVSPSEPFPHDRESRAPKASAKCQKKSKPHSATPWSSTEWALWHQPSHQPSAVECATPGAPLPLQHSKSQCSSHAADLGNQHSKFIFHNNFKISACVSSVSNLPRYLPLVSLAFHELSGNSGEQSVPPLPVRA